MILSMTCCGIDPGMRPLGSLSAIVKDGGYGVGMLSKTLVRDVRCRRGALRKVDEKLPCHPSNRSPKEGA
jgi:hypothetical protein